MSKSSVESRIDGFIAKFTPEVAAQMHAVRARLHKLIPRGFEHVYDNYNALAIGYGPTERVGDAVVSIAAYPRWVTLFFLQGVELADPKKLLAGSGSRVRSIRLSSPDDLDVPTTKAFIAQALKPAAAAFRKAPALTTTINSVSAKQRPRRPAK